MRHYSIRHSSGGIEFSLDATEHRRDELDVDHGFTIHQLAARFGTHPSAIKMELRSMNIGMRKCPKYQSRRVTLSNIQLAELRRL
jgi:hypothetical protein